MKSSNSREEARPLSQEPLAPFWPGPVIAVGVLLAMLPRLGHLVAARADYTYLSIALGLEPVPTLTHPVWYWLARGAAAVAGPAGVHLLSTLATALTAWCIYELLRTIPHDRSSEERFRETSSRVPALISGLTGVALFLLSRFFVQRHMALGPIPLGMLLWVLLLLGFLKAFSRPTPLRLAGWWLCFGLAAAESPAVILWLPIFLLAIIILFNQREEDQNPIHLLYTPLLALVGFLLLLSLPYTQFAQGVEQLTLFETPAAMVRRTLGTATRSVTGLFKLYIPVLAAVTAAFLPGAYVLLKTPDRRSENPINGGILLGLGLAVMGVFILCNPADISPMTELIEKGTGWTAPYLITVLWTGYLAGYLTVLLTIPPRGPLYTGRRAPLPLPIAVNGVLALLLFTLPVALFTLLKDRNHDDSRGLARIAQCVAESAAEAEALIVNSDYHLFPQSEGNRNIPEMIPIPATTFASMVRVEAAQLEQPPIVIDSLGISTDWGRRWTRKQLGLSDVEAGAGAFLDHLLATAAGGRKLLFHWEAGNLYQDSYRLVPIGLLYTLEQSDHPLPWEPLQAANERFFSQWNPQQTAETLVARQRFSRWQNDFGCYAWAAFQQEAAATAFQRALAIHPANEVATGNRTALMIARDGDWQQMLERLLEREPGNQTAFRALIEGLIQADDFEEALQLVEAQIKRYPDQKRPRFEQARLLLIQQKPGQAIELLRGMQSEYNSDPTFKELLFACLRMMQPEGTPAGDELDGLMAVLPQALAARRTEEATRLSRMTIRDGFVWSSTLLTLSGLQASAEGNIDAAVAQFEAALGMKREGGFSLRNHIGLLKLLDQRPEDALEDFQRALEEDPEHLPSLIGAVKASVLLDRPEEAERYLEQATALAPQDPEVLHLRGVMLMQAEQWSEAAEVFEQSLEIRPDRQHTLFALGSCLMEAGDTEQAELALNRAFQAGAGNRPLFRTLLQHYQTTGQIDRMAAIARQRLEVVPDDADAYLALVNRALHREDPVRLAELEERMAAVGLDTTAAHLGLALLSTVQGNTREAMNNYGKVLDSQPNNLIALNNLAWLEAEEGSLDRALERIDRALELFPDQPDALDTRGWILEQSGDHPGALTSYRRAVEMAPTSPQFLFHLGRLEAEHGDPDAAMRRLQSALDQGLMGADAQEARRLLEERS